MKSAFTEVRKSGLQGLALEKKGQFCKTSPGLGIKMFLKKKREKKLFVKKKQVLIKICNISHQPSFKLPRKFILQDQNAKLYSFFAVPIIVETAMEALLLLV